jgi:hypothetical protein
MRDKAASKGKNTTKPDLLLARGIPRCDVGEIATPLPSLIACMSKAQEYVFSLYPRSTGGIRRFTLSELDQARVVRRGR